MDDLMDQSQAVMHSSRQWILCLPWLRFCWWLLTFGSVCPSIETLAHHIFKDMSDMKITKSLKIRGLANDNNYCILNLDSWKLGDVKINLFHRVDEKPKIWRVTLSPLVSAKSMLRWIIVAPALFHCVFCVGATQTRYEIQPCQNSKL